MKKIYLSARQKSRARYAATSASLTHNRKLHLVISRPEHWLWFSASKFLAGLVIVFWATGEALSYTCGD